MKILVLHGPNLNLLGTREPKLYGTVSLEEINRRLTALGEQRGATVVSVQSNAEHVLVDAVQQAPSDDVDFVIINPAAFTYSSVALRDALTAVALPFIEVHLSNIHAREPWRAHSRFSDVAVGVVCGFGALGYELALLAAVGHLTGSGSR